MTGRSIAAPITASSIAIERIAGPDPARRHGDDDPPPSSIALADRHPKSGLLPPANSSERATALRWLLYLSNNVYEAIGRQDYPERYVPDPAQAPGVRARAVEDLKRFWKIMEDALGAGPYALGKRFSALDLYIANVSQWTVKDWLYENCPKIAAVIRNTAKRPRTRPVWQRHFVEQAKAAE